jgi:hypothetical protein
MLASRVSAWICTERRTALPQRLSVPGSIGWDEARANPLPAAVIVEERQAPALLQAGQYDRPATPNLSVAFRRLCDELARSGGDGEQKSALSRLVLIDGYEVDWGHVSTSVQRDLIGQVLHEIRQEPPVPLAEALVDCWGGEFPEAIFLLPREVTQSMLQLADTQAAERVQCLGLGSQAVAIECMRSMRTPVIVSPQVPFVAIFYALITGAAIEFEQRNALSPYLHNGRESRFQGPSISVPPFGEKVSSMGGQDVLHSEFGLQTSEALALEHADRHTCGIGVVFMANRVLSSHGREKELRRALVRRGRLRSVITFPPGLLHTTALPFSLIVLDTSARQSRTVFCRIDESKHLVVPSGKLRKRHRRLISGTQVFDIVTNTGSTWSRSVAREEIEKQDCVLSVDRYLRIPDEARLAQIGGTRAIVKLEDIALVVNCQTLRSLDTADGIEVHEVGPSEFPYHGYLERASRTRRVSPIDSRQGRQQILRDGDVLLATKGAIGRVALARPTSGGGAIFASPATLLLRLRPDSPISDPVVLFMYLRSPLFQSLLGAVEARTATPHVSVVDVRSLPIVVPTAEEQRRLRLVFESQAQMGREIDELLRKQESVARDAWLASGLVEAGATS